MNKNGSESSMPAGQDELAIPHYESPYTEPKSSLEWWYRLTAPAEAPPTASLAERERARRGRLSSTILLIMLIFLIIAAIGALIQSDHRLLPVLIPSLAISIVVLILNRLGKVLTAGVILVAGFEIGYMVSLIRNPGGLGTGDLPRFDLLVESVLLAVSFLPATFVPWIAVGNCLFIWAGITFLPHKADLTTLLSTQAYSIIESPIALQIIVAFVTYLWVRSANQAIERADRAEVVATLQKEIATQKQQLDEGIQQILQTHIQVANGNFQARAPLAKDNALWQIAISLNNLVARFQRVNEHEYELQKTKRELKAAQDALVQAQYETARLRETLHIKQNGQTIVDSRTDSSLRENSNSISQRSPFPSNDQTQSNQTPILPRTPKPLPETFPRWRRDTKQNS